jgi:hypothetical protein
MVASGFEVDLGGENLEAEDRGASTPEDRSLLWWPGDEGLGRPPAGARTLGASEPWSPRSMNASMASSTEASLPRKSPTRVINKVGAEG